MPVCMVPDVREAHARLCQTLAGNPSRHLKLIGVTGTNGKTTTSCLIAGVLKAADHRVGVLGTLGYLDGRIVEASTHTTPPPERLAALLARMVGNECSHAVMEVSSHALDQSRVAGVQFRRRLRDQRHPRPSRLSRDPAQLPAGESQDLPSPWRRGFRGPQRRRCRVRPPTCASSSCPALTVGIQNAAEITAVPFEQYSSEQTFLLTAGSETVPVRTQMIGTHHIYNCLAAAAVGLAYGIELTTIVRGLESVDYVPGRLERDRVRPAVWRVCRFRPHARRLDQRAGGPAAGDRRAG